MSCNVEKTQQNKAASTIAITEKKKKQVRHIKIKLLILQMRQQKTLLDYGNNDDWK